MGVDLSKSPAQQAVNQSNQESANKAAAPTKEQLEQIVRQLINENNQLKIELKKVNDFTFFKRMDYLFEVVKLSAYFEADFVDKCTSEIQEVLSESKAEENQETNNANTQGE